MAPYFTKRHDLGTFFHGKETFLPSTRWAPTSYKWSYKPYKWPYKWVTGVITLLIGLITPLITGRGPTLQKWLKVHCRQIRAAMCESALVWHKCFVPSDAGTCGSAFRSFSLHGQDLVSNHHPLMVEFPRSRLGGTLRCGEDELCFG